MPTQPKAPPSHQPADRALDDVFITPRVLDETAFTGYAESLRAIIRDADTRAARLASTSTETDRVCSTIKEAASRLEQRTTASARIAKELDTRSAHAKSVVERLANAISDNGELQRLAEQIINRRKAELTTSIDTAIAAMTKATDDAEKRAAAAEQRAKTAHKSAAEAESRARAAEQAAERAAAQAEASLQSLNEHLAGITRSAGEASARADEAHETLERSASEAVARIKSAAASTVDHAERDTESIRSAAASAIASCQETADRAASNALDAITQLRVLADDIDDRLSSKADELAETARPIEQLAEKTRALLGDSEAAGTLTAAIAKAEAAAAKLIGTDPGVQAQLRRIDDARATLSRSIDDAASALDTIDQRSRKLRESTEQDIEAIAADLSPIEHAAAGLRKRLEDFEARIATIAEQTNPSPNQPATVPLESLRTQADEITTAALRQVEEAGMWLATLIQRAEQLRDQQSDTAHD